MSDPTANRHNLSFSAPQLPAPGLDISKGPLAALPFAKELKILRNKLQFARHPESSPMTLFAPSRTIFVRVPKNASTAILSFLYGDQEGEALPHYGADFYRRLFPKEFADYLSFAVIRNPMERFASAFTYYKESSTVPEERRLMDETLSFIDDFDSFLRWLNEQEDLSQVEIMKWHHFRLQRDYICDPKGTPIVDLLFTVENMTPGLEALQSFTKRSGEVPRKNASRKQPLENLPLERIEAYYAEDTALWNAINEVGALSLSDKLARATA